MEHIGDYDGYQVYRNSEGFLEGYKKTGKKIMHVNGNDINLGTDCKRIVTNAKTMQGYIDFYLGQKLKPKKVEPAPLPKLFDPENL